MNSHAREHGAKVVLVCRKSRGSSATSPPPQLLRPPAARTVRGDLICAHVLLCDTPNIFRANSNTHAKSIPSPHARSTNMWRRRHKAHLEKILFADKLRATRNIGYFDPFARVYRVHHPNRHTANNQPLNIITHTNTHSDVSSSYHLKCIYHIRHTYAR